MSIQVKNGRIICRVIFHLCFDSFLSLQNDGVCRFRHVSVNSPAESTALLKVRIKKLSCSAKKKSIRATELKAKKVRTVETFTEWKFTLEQSDLSDCVYILSVFYSFTSAFVLTPGRCYRC